MPVRSLGLSVHRYQWPEHDPEDKQKYIREYIFAAGTDIITCPLAPASDFLKKGLSGKYILVFTCPNWQADFLNTKQIPRNMQTMQQN